MNHYYITSLFLQLWHAETCESIEDQIRIRNLIQQALEKEEKFALALVALIIFAAISLITALIVVLLR